MRNVKFKTIVRGLCCFLLVATTNSFVNGTESSHYGGQRSTTHLENNRDRENGESTVRSPTTTRAPGRYYHHVPIGQGWPVDVTIKPKKTTQTLTIAVLGRSGSGISSTIQQLIGQVTQCEQVGDEESKDHLVEYTISGIPSNDEKSIYNLKLLDVPGFVDDRSLEEDSRTLAWMKSYVQEERSPDFYLGVSKFDDSRMDGVDSLFVRFAKRLELFHEIFLNNTIAQSSNTSESNILFLLTHFMNADREKQRKPQGKIDQFRKTLQTYTSLPSPMSIVVGENKAGTEHSDRVKEEGGYYKLPNKQLYPKNIWEGLRNLTSEKVTIDLLNAMMNNRGVRMKCQRKVISTQGENFEDDAAAFAYLLTQPNKSIESNEVNFKIQEIFENNTETFKMNGIVQKVALQLRLQQENYTQISSLPSKLADRAAFFQKTDQFSGNTASNLLKNAFGIKMPEYTSSLTVGYGYVLMADEMSPLSPFITESLEPSPLGFQLPNFMKCRKSLMPQTAYFKTYSQDTAEYIKKRLNYLDFQDKDMLNASCMTIHAKQGFNLAPEEGDNMVTLTSVAEFRTLACKLVMEPNQWVLSNEFIERVNTLTPLDLHDRESPNEWKNFFETWGSHIVVNSFGGARMHGTLVGSNVRNVLDTETRTAETLNAIVRFIPFPEENLGVPQYSFYGGEIENEEQSQNLYTLEESERKSFLENWLASVSSNFVMLTNEFRLEPLSTVVKAKLGEGKGGMMEHAIKTYLQEELKFTRRRRNQTGSNSGKRTNTNDSPQHRQQPLTEMPGTGVDTSPRPYSSFDQGQGSGRTSDTVMQELEILQGQIDNNNRTIQMLEDKLKDNRARGESQHKRDLEELEKLKKDQARLAQRREEQWREQTRLEAELQRSRHETQIKNMNEAANREKDDLQRQIDEIDRSENATQTTHELMLAAIRKKYEEERKKKKCTLGIFC